MHGQASRGRVLRWMCPGLASGSLRLCTQGGAGALAPHASHLGLSSVLVPAQPPPDPWASQGTSAFGWGGQGGLGPGSRSRWGSGKERETSRQRPEWAGGVAEEQYEGREGSRVRGAVVGPFVVNLWLLSTLDPEDGGIQAAAMTGNKWPQSPRYWPPARLWSRWPLWGQESGTPCPLVT